jgi:hypothetical protein
VARLWPGTSLSVKHSGVSVRVRGRQSECRSDEVS